MLNVNLTVNPAAGKHLKAAGNNIGLCCPSFVRACACDLGMTSSRSAMGLRKTLTFSGDTAATSPRRRSSHPDPPFRSNLCPTTPTRGRASLCATRSSKQVRGVFWKYDWQLRKRKVLHKRGIYQKMGLGRAFTSTRGQRASYLSLSTNFSNLLNPY